MSNAILARMRALRQRWVELEPGLKVQVIRPLEADVQDFMPKAGLSEMDRMVACTAKYVTGWDGFTESFLLGASQAGNDPVPFDPELWADVVRDHADWIVTITRELVKMLSEHDEERKVAAKN